MKVLEPGLHTTIQDHGRYGYQKFGFSPAGAMDQESFQLANLLVNNPSDTPVLEMMMTGGTFEFEEKTMIALTGAECHPLLNGKQIPLYESVSVESGDTLQCRSMTNGLYTYLAVKSGFKIEKNLGSASTHTLTKIGGVKGSPLKKDATLIIEETGLKTVKSKIIKEKLEPIKKKRIRVVLSPPERLPFETGSLENFFHSAYHISSQSNRMGYRLKGEPLHFNQDSSMLSEGTVLGSIQIPPDGQPIVLLNDRQTTGGYPILGVICQVDRGKFVQNPIGATIEFEPISLEEAQQLYLEQNKWFIKLKEQLKEQESVHRKLEQEKAELEMLLQHTSFKHVSLNHFSWESKNEE